MDWTRAIEEERAALMRIVALLGALAGLAELAAGRSPAMRGFVLWILRRAESVARDFVADGQDAPIALMPVGPAGGRPADAMRLAASLRALARQLERQLKRLARLTLGMRGQRGGGTRQSGRISAMRNVANVMSMLADLARSTAPPAPDTS
jgi:hypothetical protein